MNRQRIINSISFSCAGVLIIALLLPVFRKPNQVSIKLLQAGGRILKKANDNLDIIAIGFFIAVVVIWLGIMIACWLQGDRKDRIA